MLCTYQLNCVGLAVLVLPRADESPITMCVPSSWKLMGAGEESVANIYASIVTEEPMLNPSRAQRQALHSSWPEVGTGGQRPRCAVT